MTIIKNNTSEIMKGKICMITGANSGIGKATAIGNLEKKNNFS